MAFTVTTTWTHCNNGLSINGKPTIYAALKAKLGREPTSAELKADVRRILEQATVDAASKGKLPHQRKRRGISR